MKFLVYIFLHLSFVTSQAQSRSNFHHQQIYLAKDNQHHFIQPKEKAYTIDRVTRQQRIRKIGSLTVDCVHYEVFTIFKRIPVADGFRGKSFLCFVHDNRTVIYEIHNGSVRSIKFAEADYLVVFDSDTKQRCTTEIDFFSDEIVLGCNVGLMMAKHDNL